MHGEFFVFERPGEPPTRAQRLPLGETAGRNEAWLRDTLFASPAILPIGDIDASFAPLVPLCRELRTEAGPVDICYVNPNGLLTLVECKLWRNPEARRKVVAQVLDYARAMSRWSYSDLQRQVSIATGKAGNVPFETVREISPNLREDRFADSVTRMMRSGRFLLLIAGDGIREDVAAMAELINRNASLGFSFGLIEVALFDMGGDTLAVQPRITARTHLIERTVVLVGRGTADVRFEEPEEPHLETSDREPGRRSSSRAGEFAEWWKPLLQMRFEDPDQPSPKLFYPNNIRAALPWPGTWVTAYNSKDNAGVFFAGNERPLADAFASIEADFDELRADLPAGTEIGHARQSGSFAIITKRPQNTFSNDEERKAWLEATMRRYLAALRPILKQRLATETD